MLFVLIYLINIITMADSKYSPEEILQILNDFFHCQAAFNPEVDPGEDLTFETTIAEWRDICDLKDYMCLAKVYHEFFQLTTPLHELEDCLLLEKTKLSRFCHYIADHASRQTVLPMMSLGQLCMTASIFKTLMAKLKLRGVDIQHIRPSSEFKPLFRKHGDVILEEVSKLAPGSLTKFDYVDNWISKTGGGFFLFFFFSIIIVPIVWHFHWSLLVPLVIAISLLIIGQRFSPAKEVIGGYDTVRDLIMGMQANLKIPAN